MRSKQEIEELEAEAELACATSPTYQLMTSPRLKALVRAHHRLTSKPFKGAISRSAIATEANLPMYEATSALAVGWQDYEQACREVALVNARSEAFDVVAQTIRMAKAVSYT